MKPDKNQRCLAIGIVPTEPRVFWDRDLVKGEKKFEILQTIDTLIVTRLFGQWAIYETKHGYHLIVKPDPCTWDEVQELLYELKRELGGASIMSCRRQRIRISPKFLEVGATDISPAPVLVESNTKEELRVGRKEIYKTYDIGLETGTF